MNLHKHVVLISILIGHDRDYRKHNLIEVTNNFPQIRRK